MRGGVSLPVMKGEIAHNNNESYACLQVVAVENVSPYTLEAGHELISGQRWTVEPAATERTGYDGLRKRRRYI